MTNDVSLTQLNTIAFQMQTLIALLAPGSSAWRPGYHGFNTCYKGWVGLSALAFVYWACFKLL